MRRAHKIAVDPTPEQSKYFRRASGVARFAWNWALDRSQQGYALWKEYRCGPRPSEVSLRSVRNAIEDDAFAWMLEVTKQAPQQAIENLGAACTNFFEGRGKYPKFQKQGVARDNFRADPGRDKAPPNAVQVDGKRIKQPVSGWIGMGEAVRFVGNIKSAIVWRLADRWFVSLSIEVDHTPSVRETQAVGGVDLGVTALPTLSDGTVIEGPMALRKRLKTLRQRSRAHRRQAKGSANRRTSTMRLARLRARIANIRQDALHKATTEIVRKFEVIGIEELSVRGMTKNRTLALTIADIGAGEFRRQLDYEAPMYGSRVTVADRWFPCSRLCSAGGWSRTGLTLADREWTCDACGVVHDRAAIASINLRDFAASCAVTACGALRSGLGLAAKVKRTAVKQEPEPGILVRVSENGMMTSPRRTVM
jgi:putative transposase